MAHSTGATPVVRATDPLLTTVRVLTVLTVLTLVSQFVTAGELVTRDSSEVLEPAHAVGAIVLHVLSGLTALSALAFWRLRGAAIWPGVVATVVFALTFVQANYGSGRTLYIHVPGAMILTIGAVVVAAWAFLPSVRSR